MDKENIKIIITSYASYIKEPLEVFIEKNATINAFPDLNHNGMREDLWNAIFTHLENPDLKKIHQLCLSAIRILSRDKTNINDVMKDKFLNLLKERAHLYTTPNLHNSNTNYSVIVESLKCLCNLVYNSEVARIIALKNDTIEGIIYRLRTFRDPELPHDVKFFDMRLLFLLTALCDEIRPKIKEELHGLTYLIETLDLITKSDAENSQAVISDLQCDLASEILKTLFNLTLRPVSCNSVDEEEESHFIRLTLVLHDLLLKPIQTEGKKFELHNHIINLLTNLPNGCLKDLTIVVHDGQEVAKDVEYEGHNMEAVYQILSFLKHRFSNISNSSNGQQLELLSPSLNVLLKCCMCNKLMRKYLRQQILPPLRDVHTRPEQGNTLRNHLCRLLTSCNTQDRNLAAELLFVLCKENVPRMIKYTGYGNAAGLFANRGLLGDKCSTRETAILYSSDSENSDTDEFEQFRHGINPVLGCYETPHPDPTEGMSDEQKEYEAMKLVEVIDNLTRQGIVRPCRIGEDGKPEPIDHVLQLQEELPKQQIHHNDE